MSRFTEAVEHYCEGLTVATGAAPGCEGCLDCDDPDDPSDDWHDWANEGSFSWSDCESCGSTLGGSRYPAHGIVREDCPHLRVGTAIHMNICADCLIYHANGDEPDEWHPSPESARRAARD